MTKNTTTLPDSTLLIDAGGTSAWWLYDTEQDHWYCFDEEHDIDTGDVTFPKAKSAFQGFDEGVAGIIKSFGLRVDAAADTVEEEIQGRPRAVAQHGTTRDYAASLVDLVGGPQRADLKALSLGHEVDVNDVRKAATLAISIALGKKHWPFEKREEAAKRARHLIHWADAIIENQLDQLPAYVEGERSRKVKAVTEALDATQTELADAQAALATVIEERELEKARSIELIKEKTQLEIDFDEKKAQLEIEIAEEKAGRLTAQERNEVLDEALATAQGRANRSETAVKIAERIIKDQTDVLNSVAAERDRVTFDRDTVATVLDYALGLLDERDQGRVFGYWDAKLEGE